MVWSVPSHYLNQCWNVVDLTLRNKLQWNINQNSYIFIQEIAFENVVWKIAAILSRPQCVNIELCLQQKLKGDMAIITTERNNNIKIYDIPVAFYNVASISNSNPLLPPMGEVEHFDRILTTSVWFSLVPTIAGNHKMQTNLATLIHWGRDKMTVFSQTTFSNAFSLNENVWILINISLKFIPKVQIENIPALVQIMAWRQQGDKPLSEPMMVSLLTHMCINQPQWV